MSPSGRRGRLVAVLLSALACPGAGQLYRRQYVRGGLLVFASLALVTGLFVKAWSAMMEMMMSTPPELLLSDLMGAVHAVMDKEAGFFTWSGYLFLAVWIYGVTDAAFSGGPGGEQA